MLIFAVVCASLLFVIFRKAYVKTCSAFGATKGQNYFSAYELNKVMCSGF